MGRAIQITLQSVTVAVVALSLRWQASSQDSVWKPKPKRAGREAQQVNLNDPLGYLRKKKRTAAGRKKAFADSISSRKVKLDPERLGYQKTTLTP